MPKRRCALPCAGMSPPLPSRRRRRRSADEAFFIQMECGGTCLFRYNSMQGAPPGKHPIQQNQTNPTSNAAWRRRGSLLCSLPRPLCSVTFCPPPHLPTCPPKVVVAPLRALGPGPCTSFRVRQPPGNPWASMRSSHTYHTAVPDAHRTAPAGPTHHPGSLGRMHPPSHRITPSETPPSSPLVFLLTSDFLFQITLFPLAHLPPATPTSWTGVVNGNNATHSLASPRLVLPRLCPYSSSSESSSSESHTPCRRTPFSCLLVPGSREARLRSFQRGRRGEKREQERERQTSLGRDVFLTEHIPFVLTCRSSNHPPTLCDSTSASTFHTSIHPSSRLRYQLADHTTRPVQSTRRGERKRYTKGGQAASSRTFGNPR